MSTAGCIGAHLPEATPQFCGATDVDELLRQGLKEDGLKIGHLWLAIAPNGTGVVRGNVGPAEMGDMAELLAEIANGAATQRPNNEPLN